MVNYDHLYDPEYFRKLIKANYMVEKELSYSVYENAYIVPYKGRGTGVYTEKKEFVDCSSLHNSYGIALAKDDVVEEQYMDETVVYLGAFTPCWGHIITDNIRRFWFLKTSTYLNKFKDCKLVFANYSTADISENVYEIFKILGVGKENLFFPQDIVQCRKVIIPDDCFWCCAPYVRFFTPEYRNLIYEIRHFQTKNFIENKKFEKVYFSYAKIGKKSGCVGEEKLERFFEKQGYKIVYPEEYSLKEQLNILANCHYFASTVGSCSHNIIFLPKHANVVLMPRYMGVNHYQAALNDIVDLEISYIDVNLSVSYGEIMHRPPFYFYVSENLKAYFGDDTPSDKKYYEEQFFDFTGYVKRGGYT